MAWQEHLSNTSFARLACVKPMNHLFSLIYIRRGAVTVGGSLKTRNEGQKCHSFVIRIGVTNKDSEFVSTV
jgi:hypothetical protein